MPLHDLIPHNLSYLFRDLYEAYWGVEYPGMVLDALAASHAAIVATLAARHGGYGQTPSLAHTLDIAGHALLRLEQMLDAGGLRGNKDAKVFIDALCDYFDEIKLELFKLDGAA